jgi:DhnA family fructose-bisphosphate aldolase class Ia
MSTDPAHGVLRPTGGTGLGAGLETIERTGDDISCPEFELANPRTTPLDERNCRMKSYRMNRLFHPQSGRCFDVAVDHGMFNLKAMLKGIEDERHVVQTLVDAGPDAIQLTPGQAPLLQSIPGRGKPSLVLRTDIANVYHTQLPRTLYSRMIEQPVEQALHLDATCVVVNLFQIPGEPEVSQQCVENILKIKPLCEQGSMPLMIEPLVFRPNEEAGGYMVDGDPDKIVPLVRQAVELGADIIKADPTDDPADYWQVTQIAGDVPVLVRGGGRVSDEELLKRTEAIIQQGAAGIVYGRNVIQHSSPAGITRALMSVVHEGSSANQALEMVATGARA